MKKIISDWIILYDKFVPGCDRHPIFGDEETGTRTYANRTSPFYFHIHIDCCWKRVLLLWDS